MKTSIDIKLSDIREIVLKDLYTKKSQLVQELIKHKSIKTDKFLNENIRRDSIKKIIKLESRLTSIEKQLNFCKKHEQFNKFISITNSKIMTKVVEEGIVLSIDQPYLGKIVPTAVERTHFKSIDWGKSNKKKQQLLDSGLEEKDLKSKDNPDGVAWHVYFTNDYYAAIFWRKGLKDEDFRKKFASIEKFYFRPYQKYQRICNINIREQEKKYLTIYKR